MKLGRGLPADAAAAKWVNVGAKYGGECRLIVMSLILGEQIFGSFIHMLASVV